MKARTMVTKQSGTADIGIGASKKVVETFGIRDKRKTSVTKCCHPPRS